MSKWWLDHCLPTITHTEIHGGTSSWRVCAGPECQQESLDDNFHSWLYNRFGKGLGQYTFEALILYKWAVCRSNDDPGQSHQNHLCQRTMAKWRQWLWVACASICYINMWRPWPSNHPVWSATDTYVTTFCHVPLLERPPLSLRDPPVVEPELTRPRQSWFQYSANADYQMMRV